MILKISRCFLIGIAMVCSANAAAQAGMTSFGTVSEVYVNAGWTQVEVTGIDDNATNNPAGCRGTVDGPFYIAIEPSRANYNAMHAQILTAQATGQQIGFFVSNCGGQGDRYPHAASVFTRNPAAVN